MLSSGSHWVISLRGGNGVGGSSDADRGKSPGLGKILGKSLIFFPVLLISNLVRFCFVGVFVWYFRMKM